MKTVLPLTIAGDRASAVQLLAQHASEGESVQEQLLNWLITHAGVEIDEESEQDIRIEKGPEPPGVDSYASVWVKTSTPVAIAVYSDRGWVIYGSGEGGIRPIWDSSDGFSEAQILELNSNLKPLSETQKTKLGLTGQWGVVQNPPIKGVIYA
jgi:hypothetical protein